MHPELTEEDVAYVTSAFRPQTESDRQRAARGVASEPSYVLPDGRTMVSAEPDVGLGSATDPDGLRRLFVSRWVAAGGREQDADAELAAWLDGGYGVCLRSPAPESILAKEGLAQAITALIAQPLPQSRWWQATLRLTVAAYDELVLPFASVDPARFGTQTSRTRLIDAVRERWPTVFQHDHPDTD
jgi:Family of unknown function (DUF6058)